MAVVKNYVSIYAPDLAQIRITFAQHRPQIRITFTQIRINVHESQSEQAQKLGLFKGGRPQNTCPTPLFNRESRRQIPVD